MARQVSTSRNDLESTLLDETSEPMALPLSFLENITNGFSEDQEIGRGGFAVVYKGTLNNGLTVAVKRLSHCYMHEKEFHREVECLLKVKHTNIVRFLGYCADTQGSMADFNGQVVMADVQQRLLCFDYLPKGSLDEYINDPSSGLEWTKRYKIIKGICEGLSYLHRKNIIHLDLKPANILLDANMVPKISDFGLSRIFEEDKSRFVATKVGGTMGYLAPEFTSNVITHRFDLYSLGVILIEILTGTKGYQDIETVLESWSNRLDKSQGDTSFEQIRVCVEIAIECIDANPEKRPVSIHHIVGRLNETESSQVNSESSELLDVQPLVLRFPFESYKSIRCLLQLTNNSDEVVHFELMNTDVNLLCLMILPLHGTVPPRSSYTLVVTTKSKKKLPEQKYFDLILKSSSYRRNEQDGSYEKIERKMTLKVIFTPQRRTIMSESGIKVSFLDTLQEYMLLGHTSDEAMKLVGSFSVSSEQVSSIKFIERKKWFVAGTKEGFIHVYSYDNMKKIKSFRASTNAKSVKALAVHPTHSYLLSVSAKSNQANLWDWNRGWECTQVFTMEYSNEILFVFNPMDITIASASEHTVKIWGPDSAEPKYTLSGHSRKVNCLQFFSSNDLQYLITGSADDTVKIWDMQKKMCVQTLEALGEVISINSFQNFLILITGGTFGTLCFWSSSSFRVEKVLQIGCRFVRPLSCFLDPRRCIIEHEKRSISIMYISNVGYEPGSTDSCEKQLNADRLLGNTAFEDSNVSAREKSMKVDHLSEVILSTSRLLEVHPTPDSLELINNTDESVAFRVMRKGGIVPAKSTYTLIVEYTKGAILESSISGDRYVTFENQFWCDEFFEEAREMGNAVHDLALEAIYARQGETTSSAIPRITKIILDVQGVYGDMLHFLDVHPTDPLILTGHEMGRYRGKVCLWNYDTPAKGKLETVCEKPPYCVKFVVQKQRFVAGTSDGFIHVYSYGTDIKKIISFKSDDYYDTRLADDSTKSYVSSLSAGLIKLWGWKKCTQTFEAVQSCVKWPAAFNPKDMNCFAVASDDYTIKVSSLDSPRSKYTLSGHSSIVNCLEFFKRNDQHYLISGSCDCTAKIWDLQRKTCVHTLRSFTSPVMSVISLRDLPYLLLSSRDGCIHMWNSKNSRLERTVSFGCSQHTLHLYLMGTRRVVIERGGRISFMDIDNEGSAVTSFHME